MRLRRQQRGIEIMIRAGIIGGKGVKVTSVTYCDLLSKSMMAWMGEIFLDLLHDFIFMHNNATTHSARAAREFIATLGIQGEKLMDWPSSSPNLNPIEKNQLSNGTCMPMDVNLRQRTIMVGHQ